MLEDLSLMVDKIFELMGSIFDLYTAEIVLGGVLVLWLLRRVIRFFRAIS